MLMSCEKHMWGLKKAVCMGDYFSSTALTICKMQKSKLLRHSQLPRKGVKV